MMASLGQAFSELPTSVGAAVLCGSSDHVCAGLGLAELKDRDAVEGLHHSRSWHRILSGLEFGRIPISAALHCTALRGRRRRA